MCLFVLGCSIMGSKGLGNTSGCDAGGFLRVYGEIFTFRDGSVLAETDTRATETMRTGIQRLLGSKTGACPAEVARRLQDDELLRILFLAVAGNFTVADRVESGLPQGCALVVDAGTGELSLRDGAEAQSVILEVLLIVSILCLMRTWGARG
jgi:hypothetical protein